MSPRRRMRRFVPKDWVYTEDGWRESTFSQNSGISTLIGLPLVYSTNSRRVSLFGVQNALPGAGTYQSGAALPEVPLTVVYAVQGHLVYNPSAWALGNDFLWAWQVRIAPMEPTTGLAILPSAYSLWEGGANIHLTQWSNDRNILAEGRWYRSFGENTSNGSWRADVRWSSRRGRSLDQDEGLFLFVEGAGASVNSARNRCFVRTLVKKPR